MKTFTDFFKGCSNTDIRVSIQELLETINIQEDIIVEAKIGCIFDKIYNQRIQINCLHPIVYKKLNQNLNFSVGITKDDLDIMFKKIKTVIEHDKVIGNDEKMMLYKGKRYILQNKKILKNIEKVRIEEFYIYMPKSKYDIIIIVSQEQIVSSGDESNLDFTGKEAYLKEYMVQSVQLENYKFYFIEANTKNSIECELNVNIKSTRLHKQVFSDILFGLCKQFETI